MKLAPHQRGRDQKAPILKRRGSRRPVEEKKGERRVDLIGTVLWGWWGGGGNTAQLSGEAEGVEGNVGERKRARIFGDVKKKQKIAGGVGRPRKRIKWEFVTTGQNANLEDRKRWGVQEKGKEKEMRNSQYKKQSGGGVVRMKSRRRLKTTKNSIRTAHSSNERSWAPVSLRKRYWRQWVKKAKKKPTEKRQATRFRGNKLGQCQGQTTAQQRWIGKGKPFFHETQPNWGTKKGATAMQKKSMTTDWQINKKGNEEKGVGEMPSHLGAQEHRYWTLL